MQTFFYLKTFCVPCRDDSVIEDLILKGWIGYIKELRTGRTKIQAIEKRHDWITVMHEILEEKLKVPPDHILHGRVFPNF